MPSVRHLLPLALLLLAGCAGLQLREPLRVTVAGLEPLPSEGLEARFAVKLRLQNPNDEELDFDGVSLQLDLGGMSFGSGVSDQQGTVPRYGETLVTVPVTVPVTSILRQVLALSERRDDHRIQYRLRGRLGGLGLGGGFDSHGDLVLPGPNGLRRR